MRKGKSNLKKTLGIVLVIVLVCVFLYWKAFYRADVLQIENGKVIGANSTWLIGKFAQESGGEEAYYKVASVYAPKDFTQNKKAADPDGDEITTFFAYTPKNSAETLPEICITCVKGAPAEAALLYEGEAETARIAETDGVTVLSVAENRKTLVFLMPSPYPNASIAVEVAANAGAAAEDLTGLCALAVEKITPEKQLSPLAADFKLNFLDDSRWKYLTSGLLVTLEITLIATLLGIVLGVVVATVRSTYDQNAENMRSGPGKTLLTFANGICKIYLTVIRGTPVVIQLMLMYYVILSATRNGVLVAMIAFGVNSGAYVAEIIRGGIMSIDRGQLEAGRSLGFNYVQTMRYVIIPQAMKNVLPSLANEFIVLLKETSVAGYVAVKDLTKGGDIIRGVTYSPFMPLIAVALIYLALVMFFNALVGKLERRLRSSER